MKKGKENKKLNKFLAANLSVIMCLSSVPSAYTVVAAEEDDESTFSIEVQDLFRSPVEEAVVDFKVYSSSEEDPIYDAQVNTNSEGVAEFKGITESIENYRNSVPEEGAEVTEETFTFCYSANKDGYYGDTVQKISEEFENSSHKLYMAEKADISGTVDFIGANLSKIDPVYSMNYSIDGIYEDIGPDPIGISKYLGDLSVDDLLEIDQDNKIDFVFRDMPLAPNFSVTVTPDFTVDVENGQGDYRSYRETTKKVQLGSKDDLSSVGIKVEPEGTKITFPDNNKNGVFSVNGEPVTGSLFLRDDIDHLDLSFIPNKDVMIDLFYVSFEGQLNNDLLEQVKDKDNEYILHIPAPGTEINLDTSVIDITAPEGSAELVNKDEYIQSQKIKVTVSEGYSDTVTINLEKLNEESETWEEIQSETCTSQDEIVFDILNNGIYQITAVDETGNSSFLSLAEMNETDDETDHLIEIQNIDTIAPVQIGETDAELDKKSKTYTVSFDLKDPVSELNQNVKPSGIKSVRYEVQAENPQEVELKAKETIEDETTGQTIEHYELKLTEDEFVKCVVYASDGAGNLYKFSPSNKPYLDISVENPDEWASEKNIHVKVQKPVSSEAKTAENETDETEGQTDDQYSVEILNSKGKRITSSNIENDVADILFRQMVSQEGEDYFVKVTDLHPEEPEQPLVLTQKIHISKIDTTAAQINLSKEGFNNRTYVSSVPLTYKAGDEQSGLKEFRIFRKLAASEDSSFDYIGTISSEEVWEHGLIDEKGFTEYKITFPTEFEKQDKAPVTGKKYTYKVEAVNGANIESNEETDYKNSVTTNILYDFDKPEITDIQIAEGKKWFLFKNVTLTFKAKDAPFEDRQTGSGIEKCEVKLVPEKGEGGDWKEATKVLGGYSYTIDHTFKGYIHIRATDKAGNETVTIVNGSDGPAIDIIDAESVKPELSVSLKDGTSEVNAKSNGKGDLDATGHWCKNDISVKATATLGEDVDSVIRNVRIDWVDPKDPSVIINSMTSESPAKEVEFKLGVEDIKGYLGNYDRDKTGILKFVITATTKHGVSTTKTLSTKFDHTAPVVEIDDSIADDRTDFEEIDEKYYITNEFKRNEDKKFIFKLADKESGLSNCSVVFSGDLYYRNSEAINKVELNDEYNLDYEIGIQSLATDPDGYLKINEIDPFKKIAESEDLKKKLKDLGAQSDEYAFVGSISLTATDNAGNITTSEIKQIVIDEIKPDKPVVTASIKEDGREISYSSLAKNWTNKDVELKAESKHPVSGIKEIKIERIGENGIKEPVSEVSADYSGTDNDGFLKSLNKMIAETANVDDFTGEYIFKSITWAGNESDYTTFQVHQDITNPVVERIELDEDNLIDSTDKPEFTLFDKKSRTLSFKTDWNISGRQSEEYALSDAGQSVPDSSRWQNISKEGDSIKLEPNSRFFVHYRTTDKAANETVVHSTGVILDNQKPVGLHNSEGIDISLPETNENGFYDGSIDVAINVIDPAYSGSQRDEKNGVYSGLSSVTYRIYTTDTGAQETGTLFNTSDGAADGFNTTCDEGTDYLKKTLSGSVRIDGETFNSNNVIFEVTAVDRAGNVSVTSTKLGDIKIDTTAPVISVSYDNNDPKNDRYYKADRTATIVITERNFNADDVKLTIANTDGTIPAISEWIAAEADGNGDATTHTATISYTADGDYTFGIEYADLAGNKAGDVNYAPGTTNPNEFTIDKTKPLIDVKYNINNGSGYYNETRVATIEVNEHNFDSSKVDIKITAEKGEIDSDRKNEVPQPAKSSWTNDPGSDIHRMTIEYAEDADYVFNIEMTDLADNANDSFSEQEFTVDKQFENFNVLVKFGEGNTFNQDNSHVNDGAQTNPTHGYSYQEIKNGISVQFSDINLDKKSTSSKLEWTHRDAQKDEAGATDSLSNRDKEGSLDFIIDPTTRTTDGIYTLSSTVRDLAGNQKSADLKFSISKYGSFYMYEKKLADLQQKGSLQYVQDVDDDLVITEYNPSGVQDKNLSVVISRDSNALSKEEIANGVKTGELLDPDHKENQSGWYKRGYTIAKSNFAKEGLYGISVSSTDDAGTVSQNDAANDNVLNEDLEPKIQFYVDKNAPALDYVNGIDGESFNAEQRDVDYSVSDTIGLAKVEVYLTNLNTGEKVKADEVDIRKLDNDKKYAGTITVKESNSKQKLSFVITDKSGRVFDTDSKTENELAGIYTPTFLMSSNPWILFTNNKPLFYGSIAGVVAVLGGLLAFFFLKNRKDEDEEEQDTAAI